MKFIKKEILLKNTKDLVSEERQVTLKLIEHLREIERRMLYAELGFSSLFEFCIKYLGLSEGSAQRRISAMRLSRDVSRVKEKLESGELSLSNAAKIQSAFRKNPEKLNQAQKEEIVLKCIGSSQSECEKKLFSLLPSFEKIEKQEKVRQINESEQELRLVLDKELQDKIAELKNLLAHAVPSNSTLDLIEYLITKELKSQRKKKSLRTSSRHQALSTQPLELVDGSCLIEQSEGISTQSFAAEKVNTCEFPNCTSTYKLERDHIHPKSLGGTDHPSNFRLLCRTHNLYMAKQKLGSQIMKKYLPELR